MSRIWQVAGIVAVALMWLVLFDVVGVAITFVLDVVPLRRGSPLLGYAVWFVLGVFCGLVSYGTALGEGPRAPGSPSGTLVLATLVGIIAALLAACFVLLWSGGGAGDSFVPDSPSLTMVFSVAFLGGAALGHHASPSKGP